MWTTKTWQIFKTSCYRGLHLYSILFVERGAKSEVYLGPSQTSMMKCFFFEKSSVCNR